MSMKSATCACIPNELPEYWKLRHAEAAGARTAMTGLGFEVYSTIAATGYSKEYWRNIDQNRYACITYVVFGDNHIRIEEIFP